ncbi:MAG: DUF4260 domain-containing protein [Anaerolineales bacterium]|nr:DUF4260 domain-containing protein [Anaerolineales bacterium]
MKNLLRLEELALFALGLAAYTQTGLGWGWFLLLLFAPDLGALGYLLNPRTGAFTYNLTHHRGLAVLLYLAGHWLGQPVLVLAGVIIFTHAALDRMLGYGLKYPDSFQNTHLGPIGRARQQQES